MEFCKENNSEFITSFGKWSNRLYQQHKKQLVHILTTLCHDYLVATTYILAMSSMNANSTICHPLSCKIPSCLPILQNLSSHYSGRKVSLIEHCFSRQALCISELDNMCNTTFTFIKLIKVENWCCFRKSCFISVAVPSIGTYSVLQLEKAEENQHLQYMLQCHLLVT